MLFKLYKLFIFIGLFINNKFSKKSLLDSNSTFLVSLTSYNKRLDSVFYTIESIGRGIEIPNRIILWLSPEDIKKIPESLERLKYRGLEVKQYKDIKSYKKLIPAIKLKNQLGCISHIVTCDDDIVFPRSWLNLFSLDVDIKKQVIVSQRARKIKCEDGQVDVYNNWNEIKSSDIVPEKLIFPTGGAGSCYPVSFLGELEKQGDLFLSLAPEQDDVWFWAIAYCSNYKQKHIKENKMENLIHPPGSQASSLWSRNVQQIENTSSSPNDIAIRNVIEKFDLNIECVKENS